MLSGTQALGLGGHPSEPSNTACGSDQGLRAFLPRAREQTLPIFGPLDLKKHKVGLGPWAAVHQPCPRLRPF